MSYPDDSHRCHALAATGEYAPEVEYQVRTCLTSAFSGCPRYQAHQARHSLPADDQPQPERSRWGWVRVALWGVVALLMVFVGLRLAATLAAPEIPLPTATAMAAAADNATPTPSATSTITSSLPAWPTPDPNYTPAAASARASGQKSTVQRVAAAVAGTPAPQTRNGRPGEMPATPTLGPDETMLRLTPAPAAVGWVGSGDARGNHFGDSFLHAGVVQGELFHAALQFDLSRLRRGAPIRYAALLLTGLQDKRLDRDSNAPWELRWLAAEVNENWNRKGFQDIHNAAVFQTILPPLGQADLAPLVTNQFVFSREQLALLQQAVVDEQYQIAFRLDGPAVGADNLFTWDTGYGPATRDMGPELWIVAGPPPPTPPPIPTRDYIVVTSTPTPENVLTAAARVQTATALATMVGTPTPTPRPMVTATPTPANKATMQAERLRQGLPPVVTPTPTPANQATATALSQYVTAVAMTTGTWTPTPQNVVTATPTPTFVVVTNTPTPRNAATLLARVIAEATRTATAGPPTPVPAWVATVTPRWIVVTSTPRPENRATVQARQALATIVALTTGTYTPTPANMATATWTPAPTPLPLVVPLSRLTATPTPRPSRPTPATIPDFLRGKIVFVSDRLGDPRLFVMDSACVYQPEGCGGVEVSWLTQSYPHQLAWQQEQLSADGRRKLIVQPDTRGILQIYFQDFDYDVIKGITALSGACYDPVWSPDNSLIAFVSAEAGNDELYTIRPDGSDLRRLTFNSWEWDKHPTWSPDGSLILFYSNRDTGRRQLWVMNADGSAQHNISNNDYNDWDPVWVK